ASAKKTELNSRLSEENKLQGLKNSSIEVRLEDEQWINEHSVDNPQEIASMVDILEAILIVYICTRLVLKSIVSQKMRLYQHTQDTRATTSSSKKNAIHVEKWEPIKKPIKITGINGNETIIHHKAKNIPIYINNLK
ncbi:hypothetical protein J1N35_023651, partial [Gossypium stocksii]